MRIVIDSNVWISAMVFGGNPRHIFTKIVTNGWTIIASEEIFTEIRRTLEKKFAAYLVEFDNLKRIIGVRMIVVPLGTEHINVSRDEDDNRVIETAVIGKAAYIVSGDKDLLVLECYGDITIQSPTAFLKSVAKTERGH